MAMATAKKQPPGFAAAGDGGRGRFQVHKPGEGYATRLGAFVVAMLFVAFTCHHWFYGWTFLRNVFDKMFQAVGLRILAWTYDPDAARGIAISGTIVLMLLGGLLAFYIIYCRQRSAEFLVKTDGELAKVTWPKIMPWFKPSTQVWGATYVVLIVLAVLTIYIMIVDRIFSFVAQWLFYN